MKILDIPCSSIIDRIQAARWLLLALLAVLALAPACLAQRFFMPFSVKKQQQRYLQPLLHVRSVHYDYRSSEAVALLELPKSIRFDKNINDKLGMRLRVDGKAVAFVSTGFSHLKGTDWANAKFPSLTHTYTLVKANLGDLSQLEKPQVSVVYEGVEYFPEKTFVAAAPAANSTRMTGVICLGPLFGTPPTLFEWFTYHMNMGFEHVYAYITDDLHNETSYRWFLEHPRVTIIRWKPVYTPDQIFYRSSDLVATDCMFRAMPFAKHAFVGDSDDYMVGATPAELAASKECQPCCKIKWFTRYIDSGLEAPSAEAKWWDIPGRIKCKAKERDEKNFKSFYTLEKMQEMGRHKGKSPLCNDYSKDNVYVAHCRTLKTNKVGPWTSHSRPVPQGCTLEL